MAMRIRRYIAKHITHDGRSRATLDAIIHYHLASICPVSPRADVTVIDFGVKNWVVALWNRCFEPSAQKAQNESSTQHIEATSCVERVNATVQAEEHS